MKASPNSTAEAVLKLSSWFEANARPLPWRKDKNPYSIWISEIMLQQTTVAAVIPFFERFMKAFPTVENLARAPIDRVLEHWAGLGYYSRARNIHKAAQIISEHGFSKSWEQLIELPGFGPYTSRAVSSLAFEEKVGVLDGNVIRFLSRFYGLKVQWWLPKERQTLQQLADEWAQLAVSSSRLNQALMEIGATICLPRSAKCQFCPLLKSCVSVKNKTVEKLPLQKPRRKIESFLWTPVLISKKDKFALIKNDYLPFLKGQWVWPGAIRKIKKPPTKKLIKHTITHHDIYVQPKLVPNSKSKPQIKQECLWVSESELPRISPSSLLKKALHSVHKISQT